jgi:RimJ/RimL family protein N-acetyltransferase
MHAFERIDVQGVECYLRPYRIDDVTALQQAANDIRVARYMFVGFPHPYTVADAQWWVEHATAQGPTEHFVIEVNGSFAGAVGLSPSGLGRGGVGVIGYWLRPEWWGRGIVTAVVRGVVEYAFANGFRRLEASVYQPNLASARVLEKNRFMLEGRLRKHRIGRDGEIMDELLYGLLRDEGTQRS